MWVKRNETTKEIHTFEGPLNLQTKIDFFETTYINLNHISSVDVKINKHLKEFEILFCRNNYCRSFEFESAEECLTFLKERVEPYLVGFKNNG